MNRSSSRATGVAERYFDRSARHRNSAARSVFPHASYNVTSWATDFLASVSAILSRTDRTRSASGSASAYRCSSMSSAARTEATRP
jgi:hypothetical protein